MSPAFNELGCTQQKLCDRKGGPGKYQRKLIKVERYKYKSNHMPLNRKGTIQPITNPMKLEINIYEMYR